MFGARGAQVDAVGAGAIAGGLVGYLSGASEVVENWFSGEVEGAVAGGGLIGDGELDAGGAVRANWAVARTQGATVGGFAARAGGGEWLRNWSSGRVIGADAEAGFANPRMGVGVNAGLTDAFASNYWGQDASGNTATNGVLGSAIETAQDIDTDLAGATQWASEWNNVAPADNNLFPVLRLQDADLQAAAIADGLVELQSFFGDDIAILDYRSGNTIAPTDFHSLGCQRRGGGRHQADCRLRCGFLGAHFAREFVQRRERSIATGQCFQFVGAKRMRCPDSDE